MPPFDVSDAVFPDRNLEAEIPVGPQTLQFRHRTVSGVAPDKDNVEFPFYWTRLDHPALNDRPQAILTVTNVGRLVVNEQAHTATLVQNEHPVGIVYRFNRWYIYNLNLEAMASGADFHVAIHQDVVA